jgi:hypothetical protein
MHLFKKWSKYAFAHASMQMHYYPKPSYNEQIELFGLVQHVLLEDLNDKQIF